MNTEEQKCIKKEIQKTAEYLYFTQGLTEEDFIEKITMIVIKARSIEEIKNKTNQKNIKAIIEADELKTYDKNGNPVVLIPTRQLWQKLSSYFQKKNAEKIDPEKRRLRAYNAAMARWNKLKN